MSIDRLYVVRDDDTTIVSRCRINVTGAGMRTAQWGGWEETVSARQSLLPARSFRGAAGVVLPPVMSAGALWIAGAGPEIIFGVGAAVFLAGAYLMPLLTRLRPAANRDGTEANAVFRTLFDPPERQRFHSTLEVAERITETWPELSGLIGRGDGERALNRALWDVADLLSRRQQIRRIAESLETERAAGTPVAEAVSRELSEQVATAGERLRRLDLELASRIGALEAAEAAGRRFVREQRLIQTLRETALSLNSPADVPSADAGAELAGRTAAVTDAYRELSRDFRPADG